jgi:hypothetical protein
MPQLTDEERDFISKNKATKTVPELARALKRGDATVYDYFKAKGWKPHKNPQERRQRSHPFRQMNRRLEAVIIQRRIENRAYNPKKG